MAKLNEKQYAAIEYLALPKRGGKTYEEIAEEVGVHRDTLLKWRNDDEFNEELKRKIMRSTLDRMPEIFDSIPDHIINDGNAALFRTLLQAHSMLTERHEIETKDSNANADAVKAEIERFKQRSKTAKDSE